MLLDLARRQIDSYKQSHNGALPSLGTGDFHGWGDLVNGGLLNFAPVNLWVGGEKSDVVVIGKEPRSSFTADFGWVFNPETGELWATGFDGDGNALARVPGSTQTAEQATVPEDTDTPPVQKP